MIARFLGAVQFLTIIPVRRGTAPLGECAIFFPVIGAVLGAGGGVLFALLRGSIPEGVAAGLVLCFWALVTGGLHEDGFADCADAFRAYRPPEKILEILKDSRIGAHGALALILLSLVRWTGLSAILGDPVRPLIATFAVSRASIVALAWITPPAGGGAAREFSGTLTSATAIGSIALALLCMTWNLAGVVLLSGTLLLVLLAQAYFRRRIGGVNGDCLGATALLVESWGLIVFSCHRFM